ncbi:MAG TPA: hypothetical protein VF950_24205 [Planctomycetota bacterium]
MGNAVKCPRCASLVDVTSFAPGSSVRCSDCGGMMRVPTGRTGVNPAVKAPVAAGPGHGTRSTKVVATGVTKAKTRIVAASEMRESGTRMRSRGAPRPKSKAGLFVLLGVGALAVIITCAVLFLGGPKTSKPAEPAAAPVAKAAPKAVVAPKPPPPPAPEPVEIAAPAPAPRSGDEASKFNWEEALKQLRGGGGFDIEGRPEQVYYERVKKLGKPAYPHLIRYIDNEDPALGRAAVALLNALTGQKQPLPNDGTKGKVKADWEAWLKANP